MIINLMLSNYTESFNLYKFKYIQNIEPIEPILELYKGKLYSILNKLFIIFRIFLNF